MTGSAQTEIAPDIIYVKVIDDEKDNKKKLSLEVLERQMISTLKNIGINVETELFVSDYLSNFSKVIFKTDIYTSKEFTILAHSGKTVAQIYVELEELGISNITIEKTDHTNIQEFRRQVKVEAVKAAKDKANDMTVAIGQKTGKAIYIQEVEKSNQPYLRATNTVMRATSQYEEDKLPDVTFEKIKLEYQVLVRFVLE